MDCPARLLCPWDSPGKNTGVGCHFLLQGIFLTQGSNLVSCIGSRLFITWTKEFPLCMFCWHNIEDVVLQGSCKAGSVLSPFFFFFFFWSFDPMLTHLGWVNSRALVRLLTSVYWEDQALRSVLHPLPSTVDIITSIIFHHHLLETLSCFPYCLKHRFLKKFMRGRIHILQRPPF